MKYWKTLVKITISLTLIFSLKTTYIEANNIATLEIGGWLGSKASERSGTTGQIIGGFTGAEAGAGVGAVAGEWIGGAIGTLGGPAGTIFGVWAGGIVGGIAGAM